MALITRIDYSDSVQYVEAARLAGHVGVVIMFSKRRTGMVGAVLRSDLLQLIEELVQFSPSKPPIEHYPISSAGQNGW